MQPRTAISHSLFAFGLGIMLSMLLIMAGDVAGWWHAEFPLRMFVMAWMTAGAVLQGSGILLRQAHTRRSKLKQTEGR